MPEIVPVVASAVVGIVFLVAGASKLADRRRWAAEARELATPTGAVVPLPYVEIGLGAALVAQVAPRVTAALALVLLSAFTVLIVRVLASGRRPTCACFGAWSARPLGRVHLVRNALLMVACVVVIVGS